MGYSEVAVRILLSSNAEDNDLRDNLSSAEDLVNNVEFFYDSDQCVQSFESIEHENIFLVLGSDRSYLVDIFSTLPCICYMYLTRSHDFKHTPQVRGVFPDTQQLLNQLIQDIKMVKNNPLHLSFSSIGDSNLPQVLTKNLPHQSVAFYWSQILFTTIFHTPKPTEHVYKDMLNECRHLYRHNARERQQIDEFEEAYVPNQAIWWYTCVSFLCRSVNMALRTSNIVIIWKFRFIIQDIYRQLEILHEEQRRAAIEPQQHIHTVYCGQLIASRELQQLKDSIGHLVTFNTFISTHKDINIARIFAGDGEGPPGFESVIFEISIDESQHTDTPVTFADISTVSFFPQEEEVLISMNTVFRIESVRMEETAWRFRLYSCSCENSVNLDLKDILLKWEPSFIPNESGALFVIGKVLLITGDYDKAAEIFQLIDSSINPLFMKFRELGKVLAAIGQTDFTECNWMTTYWEYAYKCKIIMRSLIESAEYLGIYRDILKKQEQFITNCIEKSFSITTRDVSTLYKFMESYCDHISRAGAMMLVMNTDSWNNLPVYRVMKMVAIFRRDNYPWESMKFEQFEYDMNQMLAQNSTIRMWFLFFMAISAHEKKCYARAMRYLKDALSIPCNNGNHALLFELLASTYEKQNNWPGVLHCYENIINMRQLSLKSPRFVEAHNKCGDACVELGNYSKALLSYKNAVQLQSKYHSHHHHPLMSELKIKIGNLLKIFGDIDDALKSYQEVIELGHSETASEAYVRTGIVYIDKKHYDAARCSFMKALDMSMRHTPKNTIFISRIHLYLSEIEHWTGHYEKRDFHIDQASIVAASDTEDTTFLRRRLNNLF